MTIETPLPATTRMLTLWEPWGSCLVDPEGPKTAETRSWKTDYRGPVILTAAKKRLTRAEVDDLPLEVVAWTCDHTWAQYGMALGVANLVDCAPIISPATPRPPGRTVVVSGDTYGPPWAPPSRLTVDHAAGALANITPDLPWGIYTPGRYAWLWSNMTPFVEPFPVVGARGLLVANDALREAASAALVAA